MFRKSPKKLPKVARSVMFPSSVCCTWSHVYTTGKYNGSGLQCGCMPVLVLGRATAPSSPRTSPGAIVHDKSKTLLLLRIHLQFKLPWKPNIIVCYISRTNLEFSTILIYLRSDCCSAGSAEHQSQTHNSMMVSPCLGLSCLAD